MTVDKQDAKETRRGAGPLSTLLKRLHIPWPDPAPATPHSLLRARSVLAGTSAFLTLAGLVGIQMAALLPLIVRYRRDSCPPGLADEEVAWLAALTLLLPLGVALRRRLELAREAVAELLSLLALLSLAAVPLVLMAGFPNLVSGAATFADPVVLLLLPPFLCIALVPPYLIARAARYFRSPAVRAWFVPLSPVDSDWAAASGVSADRFAHSMKRLGWTLTLVGFLSSSAVIALLYGCNAVQGHAPYGRVHGFMRFTGSVGLVLSACLIQYPGALAMAGGYWFTRGRRWTLKAARSAVIGHVAILFLLHASGATTMMLQLLPTAARASYLRDAATAIVFPGCALLLWLALSTWSRLRSAEARAWCGEGEGADVACVPPAEPGRGA